MPAPRTRAYAVHDDWWRGGRVERVLTAPHARRRETGQAHR
jgi:hypothetical protein